MDIDAWWEELERRHERLAHMGEFLCAHGLNSRVMDHWNMRMAEYADLASDSPGRFERHGWNRVYAKFEAACMDVFSQHPGLYQEWEKARQREQAQPALTAVVPREI